jgi:hypothetical protein
MVSPRHIVSAILLILIVYVIIKMLTDKDQNIDQNIDLNLMDEESKINESGLKEIDIDSLPYCENDDLDSSESDDNASILFKDAIDKINEIRLSDDDALMKKYSGKPIGAIYDEMTKGPEKYTKKCVQKHSGDELNKFYVASETCATLDPSTWKYQNEKISNGGVIDNGLYPVDPMAENYQFLG